MALILNIETATKNCSVSLAKDGEIIAIKELNNGNYSHAEVLHPFIVAVLEMAQQTATDLDAVAVSKGPGSYTGLRIGVSAAKGLCFSLDIPLISIETLQALAHIATPTLGFIVPLLDARRMEVYAAVYNTKHQKTRAIAADILTPTSFQEYLAAGPVTFLGDGAAKFKEICNHPNAVFLENCFPSSKQMASLSYQKYQEQAFEEVAYFEPFYLKDFVAVPQKKK